MKTFLDLLRHSSLTIVFHVAPRFANVIIFILIGRLAGPQQAGIFSLATTYLLIITAIMRGLDELLIRQVAREPDRAANYLGNFLLLRLLVSSSVYIGLIVIIRYGLNYPATTSIPIIILALSVLPDSLALVAQSVLLGQRRFGPPAAINSVTNLIKLIAGSAALLMGGGLIEISLIWLGGSVLNLILMLAVAFKQIGGLRRVNWLDFTLLRTHWLAALSFTAITVLTAIDSQADTLLLSIFRGAAEVGWYGAATTLTFSLLMFSQAYRFAVYPPMIRYAQNAPDKLNRLFQKSIHYMAILVIPLVAGTMVLAPQIVKLIFGPKFAPTVPILQVLIVSLVFMFIVEPVNRIMFVRDKQRVIVVFVLVSAIVNITLNLIFIPEHGAIGSSLARVASTGVFFAMSFLFVKMQRLASAKLLTLIKPISAAILMSLIIVLVSGNLVISIVIGVCTYGGILFLVDRVFRSDIIAFTDYALAGKFGLRL